MFPRNLLHHPSSMMMEVKCNANQLMNKRFVNSFVKNMGPERWYQSDIRRLVKEIKGYYFPIMPNRKAKKVKEIGLPLNEALKVAREKCNLIGEKDNSEIIFRAKVKLEGENSNGIRGVLTMARPLDQNISILAFCPDTLWEKAREAGATYVGGNNLIQDVLEEKIKFDRCVASVDQMPVIAKLARMLGPKGLMPNTKTGTLTTDVIGAIKGALRNTPFKIDKETGLFELAIGRPNFTETEIKGNLKTIMEYLQSQNKTTSDGRFLESAYLVIQNNIIPIARNDYGSGKGPKFLAALERHRSQMKAWDSSINRNK